MKDNSMNSLLSQVSKIKEHYDEIAELRGENFNIFQILGVATKETKLHSALIAELLSPDGTHGKKSKFLSLFLQEIKKSGNNNLISINSDLKRLEFNLDDARVKIEVNVGNINESYDEGGRIDILITNKCQQCIIIENKINARDQQNQLLRYKNYAEKHFKNNNEILYLNLDGKQLPAKNSIGDMQNGEHFFVISYEKTILAWLEECYKETVDQPILRETIKQYIILIKQLTNQSYNQKMEKEILETMQNNIESSFLIASNIEKMKNQILIDFAEKLGKEFNGTQFTMRTSGQDLGNKDTYIVLNDKNWKFDLSIYFISPYETTINIDLLKEDGASIENKDVIETERDKIVQALDLNIFHNDLKFNSGVSLWNCSYFTFLPNQFDPNCWEKLKSDDMVEKTKEIFKSIINSIEEKHDELSFLFKK